MIFVLPLILLLLLSSEQKKKKNFPITILRKVIYASLHTDIFVKVYFILAGVVSVVTFFGGLCLRG